MSSHLSSVDGGNALGLQSTEEEEVRNYFLVISALCACAVAPLTAFHFVRRKGLQPKRWEKEENM